MDRETVLHMARLARLGLTEEELERFGAQLTDILAYVEQLNTVDVEEVPPYSELTPPRAPWREDTVTNPPSGHGELAQAPQVSGRLIVCPNPLQEEG